MKQKIVIKIHVTCDKHRTKAMKMVAAQRGVESIEISGNNKDQLKVVGDSMDSSCLIIMLRKKVAMAHLLQVVPVVCVQQCSRADLELLRRLPARSIQAAIEAVVLSLNIPCGFKFDPTDKDLVVGFLLPLVRGEGLLFDGGIIHDDPRSAPPWELLARHGRTKEAIFFAQGVTKYSSGSRRERNCVGGGIWKGQKGVDDCAQTDEEELIRWRKYMLSYHLASAPHCTGWVMHEFELTSPKCPQMLLCRIRISERGEKRRREQEEAADAVGEAMRLHCVAKTHCSIPTDIPALEAPQRSGILEQVRQPTTNYAEAENSVDIGMIAGMAEAGGTDLPAWEAPQRSGVPDQAWQPTANYAEAANSVDINMTVGMVEVGACAAFNGGNEYMAALAYHSNVKQFIQCGAANSEIDSMAGIINLDAMHDQCSTMSVLRNNGTVNGSRSNVDGFISYAIADGEIGAVVGIDNCGAVHGESSIMAALRNDGTMACSSSNVERFINFGAANGVIETVAGIGNCGIVPNSNVDGFINYGVADGEISAMAGNGRPGEALGNSTAMGEPSNSLTYHAETGYMGDFGDLSDVNGQNSISAMAGNGRPGEALGNSTAMGEPSNSWTYHAETGYVGVFGDLSYVNGQNSGTGVHSSDSTVDADISDYSWLRYFED